MSYNIQETHQTEPFNNSSLPQRGRNVPQAYRRGPATFSGSRGQFEALPTTTLYETPWDQQTPDVNNLSFTDVSSFHGNYEPRRENSDAQPLLGDEKSPPTLAYPPETVISDAKRRDSDNNVFEELGPVPSSANSQTDFGLRNTRKRRPRPISNWTPSRHPVWPELFEPIHWPPLIFLTVLVIFTYPMLFLSAFIAEGRTLFWTRFIVGAAASFIGFVLGLALMQIGKRILEAATWATLIHRSLDGRGGTTLGELDAKSTYPNFTSLGVSLLVERNIRSIYWRGSRSYDRKPWSLFVLIFTITSILAASISFLLGRLIDISTSHQLQGNYYNEVSVIGDVSASDIANAGIQLDATKSFIQTWAVSPFGDGGQVPVPVKLQYGGEDVYFAELSNHLLPGGLGLGTFQQTRDGDNNNTTPDLNIIPSLATNINEVAVGAVVRYSRWGLRLKCEKLSDPRRNIVPQSPANMTYAYVPRDSILSLMDGLGLQDVPFSWDKPFLKDQDQVPEGIDMGTIGLVGSWKDDGVAQTFYSHTIDDGKKGKGWVVFDMVMMRLNMTLTPSGSFGVHSADQTIGYDSAFCVEVIEPYVVDAYNSTTGHAQTFNVVGRGDLSTLNYDYGKRVGGKLEGLNNTLSSIGRFGPYAVGHDSSRNQIIKDNGRDFQWVPSPTAISWTDGYGPEGYTLLSAERLQASLGKADAAQFLPYLTGSQPVVAYHYTENGVAHAKLLPVPTVLTLTTLWLVGCFCAFFVPRLPLGVPRRDFSLFTWIATFEGDGILQAVVDHKGLRRHMDLEELRQQIGEQKVRYGY